MEIYHILYKILYKIKTKVSAGQFSQLDKSRHDGTPETGDVIQIHARRRIYRTQQRKQQLTISTWTRTLYVLSTWESGRRRMIHVYAWEVLALQGAHRFVYSVKYDVNTRGWTRERVKWERWKKSEIASSVATYRNRRSVRRCIVMLSSTSHRSIFLYTSGYIRCVIPPLFPTTLFHIFPYFSTTQTWSCISFHVFRSYASFCNSCFVLVD